MPQPWETAGKQPWEAAAGTQVKQAPPAYPYEAPTAAAGLTGKTISNTKDAATLPYDIQTAKNQATSYGIKAKSDQIDLNIKEGTPPGDPSKSGTEYINSLPQGVRDLTTAMLANRYPATINRNIPVVNQAVLAANHINPTFDSTRYNMRVSLMNHTLAGSDADELKALNTAITHAGMAYDQVAKIPSGADYGWSPLTHTLNALTNYNHSADPSLKNLHNMLQAYSQEKSKVYQVNTGGGQADEASNYDLNDPGKTIQSNILTDLHLLMGRAGATLNKYNVGNGGQAPLEALSPDAQAVLKRLSPDLLTKYYSQRPDPLAQAMGVSAPIPGSGNNPPPPPGNGNASPSGNTPPDYSPMAPSGMSGFSSSAVSPRASSKTVYDNQTSGLVNGYLRQGLSYHAAVAQLGKDAPGAQLNSSPSQWNEAVQWRQAHKNANVNQADATKTVPMSLTDRLTNGFAQSGTGAFLGNYENAMAFGLPKLAAGQDQSALFNSVASQNNPAQAFTGDLAGTLGGLSLAGKGVSAAARGLEGSSIPALQGYGNIIGGSAPRAALTGDTIYGGVSGAAQNPDHPVLGAIANAGAMVAGHGVGKYILGPGVAAAGDTKLGQFAVNRARSLGGLVTGGTPAPFMPPPAPELNLGGATQQALPDITSKLQQAQGAGLPYMVADADPRLRAMLGSATRFSPDVRAQAENALVPRQLGQGERAIGQINTNLAPVGDVPTLQANILKSAQTKSAPLYTAAKAQPVPDLAANPKLKEVLDRPAGQSAIRSGYETALNKGEDVGTLTYATDPQGNPVQYGNPSWNVIHYARQVLDKSGDTDVRQALDKQIAGLNPGFKAADAAYSGAMKGSDALQAGSDATAIKVTPETTLASLNNAGRNTPLFQQGYASNLADMIGRQRMAGNPYDLVNGSMFQKQKMGSVFPQGADAFNTAHSLENDMGKTYQSVIGGSPTQPRAMDDKLFTMGDMADGGMDLGAAALTGTNPIAGLISLGVRKGIDAAKFGMGKTKADAIAPFLMNQDPATSLATLSTWAQQNAARKAYLDQVRAGTGQLGAGFSAPAIYGASQN